MRWNDSPYMLKTELTRMVGGSAFLFLCRIGGAAVTFLTQLLLARWMGASELGHYVLAFAWLTLLAAIPVGGYSAAAVRFLGQGLASDSPGYARGYIHHALSVTIVSSLAITVLAAAAVSFVPELTGDVRSLLLLAIAGVPVFAAMRISNGIAMAMSRFALGYLPNNIVRPVLFLVLIWFVWMQGDALTAGRAMQLQVFVLLGVTAGTSLLLWAYTLQRLPPSPATSDSKTWNRAALPLLAVTIFSNHFQQITVVVSGVFLAASDIGIYNVGYRIAMLISFTLVAVDSFTAPALSRFHHMNDRDKMIREIRHSTALRFGISLGAVVFLGFFGEWVLAFFGAEFVQGHLLMILLALAQLAHAAVGPVTRLLAITGHQKHLMITSGATLLLWLGLTSILLPVYGVTGVAIAVLISLTTWAAVLRQFVVRFLGISILVVVRDLQEKPGAVKASSAAD